MIKKFTVFFFGIILIIFGGYLSTVYYNALPIFATVHEFSFACMFPPLGFTEAYDNPHERGTCLENYALSAILIAIMTGGVVLIVKSKGFRK